MIKVLKVIVFLLCLVPFVWLVWGALTNNLGANPLGEIRAVTGRWTLRFLLITLSVSPIRRLTGWNAAIRFRRMLGLYAFFWGFWHFISYLVLQGFDWPTIVEDVAKRRYITLGLAGFVLMIPLAITSTKKWIARLGGKQWQRLHRAIYLSAVAGVVHYLWLVKADIRYPVRYGVVLTLLLGFRVWTTMRPRFQPNHAVGG